MLLFSGMLSAQYIPVDFYNEQALPAHAYWEADGQIVNTDGQVVDDLLYYTIGTGPKIFLFEDQISFAHYYSDTIVADTAWRLDMAFVCGSGENQGCGTVSAHEITNGHLNYYLQHTGAGLENVQGHHRIVYEEVWPSIDFHFYSNKNGLKTYLVFRPGADPDDLLLQFTGQDQITTPASGAIKMHLGSRSVKFPQAFAWQDVSGTPTLLSWLPEWNNLGSGQVDLTLGAYDGAHPLIIQVGGDILGDSPEAAEPCATGNWSTYLGDNLSDDAEDMVCDAAGDLYTVGTTNSADFPVGFGQASYSALNYDMFVTKFLKFDRSLRWTTFVGGTHADFGYAIDHNRAGKVYAAGKTFSSTVIPTNFPSLGNYIQNSHGSSDGFLVRMKENDGLLEWVTHFGGEANDEINDLVATSTDVYVTGSTESGGSNTCSVPTGNQMAMCNAGSGAYFQSANQGNGDAFFARFNNAGSLTHSTFIGGNGTDQAFAIGTSGAGKLVVAGETSTTVVPTNVSSPCGVPGSGAFPLCDLGGNSFYQDQDADGFVMRFSSTLGLEWGTLFGGNTLSYVSDLDFDSNDDLVIAGINWSSVATSTGCSTPSGGSFPICASGAEYAETNAGGTTRNNIYAARFGSNATLEWSSLYGDESDVQLAPTLAIDGADNVYLTSAVRNAPTLPFNPSGPFPVQSSFGLYYQSSFANSSNFDMDAVLVAFNADNEREWATMFGGGTASNTNDHGRDDHGLALATYGTEDLLLGGLSRSLDLYQACPVVGTSYCQPQLSDLSQDAFVTRFCIDWLVNSIREEDKTSIEVLFPNPSAGSLFLRPILNEDVKQVQIYSMDGRKAYETEVEAGARPIEIQVSQLSSGAYILRYFTQNSVNALQFIKE